VTGGLGFIGSSLARRLVKEGARVTLVDSLVPSYGGNLFNIQGVEARLAVNISDIRDEYSLRHLIQEKDIVFNLAGQTSHLDSMEDPFSDLEINCRAQLSLLEACRKYNPSVKIVFASTRQVYGRPSHSPTNESHTLRPVDVNGINKMAGEFYHILYNNVYDLRASALRLTNTYGPRMRIKDARQTFLGIWIRQVVQGNPFELWEGSQLRDFTFVDDAVEALMLAAVSDKADGQVFNLGGHGAISLRELADLLVHANAGGSYVVKSFPVNRERIDIGNYCSDFTRIRDTLGWEPTVDLRDGLLRTLEFYRENLHHYL